MEFEFFDTSGLQNEHICLRLIRTVPRDPKKDFAPAYNFAICDVHTGQELGLINFRVGMTDLLYYAGNIGYNVYEEHRGHRYAAQACKLLLPLAKRHGMDEVIITCNPQNSASNRTCVLAGAKFIEIVDIPETLDLYKRGERELCIYAIDISNLEIDG